MLSMTYLAVLEPGEDGSYGISFPDLPGCFIHGENLAQAGQMAAEAASLHVYGMEQDGEEIPAPSLSLPKNEIEGLLPCASYQYLRFYFIIAYIQGFRQ